jgi:hypothetical protein
MDAKIIDALKGDDRISLTSACRDVRDLASSPDNPALTKVEGLLRLLLKVLMRVGDGWKEARVAALASIRNMAVGGGAR